MLGQTAPAQQDQDNGNRSALMAKPASTDAPSRISEASAVLVLDDGSILWGHGVGATGSAVGEVCFNTSMTGYQEIITDPSYAGQIITFTFPHIGNVGTNEEDIEALSPTARGVILKASITNPSNFRALSNLDSWLQSQNLIGIVGVDTRRLTRKIRDEGAPTGLLCHAPDGTFELPELLTQATAWPGIEGMDLAKEVSCTQSYDWDETQWFLDNGAHATGFGRLSDPRFRVVAIDFGIKRNILRCLASLGCSISVVPASATTKDILAQNPDGVFLSNGPGDPAATGAYAVPVIKELLKTGLPIFGICLGHQILSLALGAKTRKMHLGHRGANHPVKDLATGKVEITSQNHGFVVDVDTLPTGVIASHISLFDGSLEGLMLEDAPVFSVQYHPEASPGPQDSHYLFKRFIALMEEYAKTH
tara:strand:- start:256 stop:1515 length:1260 start_codon:yes stop_codon:yes gene_type:complete